MSRLTKIIAPILREHGLDVREVEGLTGDTRELVVTNPSFPHWGRVVIDRDGLLEWDHWGDINHDDGAAALARVIVGYWPAATTPTRTDTARSTRSNPKSSDPTRNNSASRRHAARARAWLHLMRDISVPLDARHVPRAWAAVVRRAVRSRAAER